MPAKHPDKCRYPRCHAWADITYLEGDLSSTHRILGKVYDTAPTRAELFAYAKTVAQNDANIKVNALYLLVRES